MGLLAVHGGVMDKLIYAKAFAAALRDHLRGVKHEWTEQEYGGGGCDTCGYGANEFDAVDMDKLDAQIDAFALKFAKQYEGK
jgi:hypothetical protein